jgi:hypothetical protein
MNEIISSRFTHDNKIITKIKNPSDRVRVLMAHIGSGIDETGEISLYVHKDIGTKEEMELLFINLERCK